MAVEYLGVEQPPHSESDVSDTRPGQELSDSQEDSFGEGPADVLSEGANSIPRVAPRVWKRSLADRQPSSAWRLSFLSFLSFLLLLRPFLELFLPFFSMCSTNFPTADCNCLTILTLPPLLLLCRLPLEEDLDFCVRCFLPLADFLSFELDRAGAALRPRDPLDWREPRLFVL